MFSISFASSMDMIKSRGYLRCGVTTGLPGFSFKDDQGNWHGFDVDMCKALSFVIFGEPDKTEFVTLTNQMAISALKSHQVDILARVTSINYSRDNIKGLIFAATDYIDQQGFMVKSGSFKMPNDLNNKTICLVTGSTSESNIADYANKHSIDIKTLVFDHGQFALRALESGRCDVLSTDQSALHILKKKLTHQDEYTILDTGISIEPLSLMIRDDDISWFKLVRWVVFALIKAEEIGFYKEYKDTLVPLRNNQERILQLKKYRNDFSKVSWAYDLILYIGNYGQIFERNLTRPFDIERGKNALIREGGVLYSPDFN